VIDAKRKKKKYRTIHPVPEMRARLARKNNFGPVKN
jgi:hypothetical protein